MISDCIPNINKDAIIVIITTHATGMDTSEIGMIIDTKVVVTDDIVDGEDVTTIVKGRAVIYETATTAN